MMRTTAAIATGFLLALGPIGPARAEPDPSSAADSPAPQLEGAVASAASGVLITPEGWHLTVGR